VATVRYTVEHPLERLFDRGGSVIAVAIALFSTCPIGAGIIGGPVTAGGYTFTNFDGPNKGTVAGAGTNHKRHRKQWSCGRIQHRQYRALHRLRF